MINILPKMRLFRKKSVYYLLILFTSLSITAPLLDKPVLAVACDTKFYSLNDILFYDPCEEVAQTCQTSASNSLISNLDYAGNQIFNSEHTAAIEANRPFYESSAEKYNIPWQVIASIHGRESFFARGIDRDQTGTGNAAGYNDGPYQIISYTYPTTSDLGDEGFQQATDDAAKFIVEQKLGGRDLSDVDNIKYVFFAYNGMASVYKTQAINLGFTEEQANNGEGSPYVMNRADAKRDPKSAANNTWGQIKGDFGSIEYPTNNDPGAFVYYSALAGMGNCGGAGVNGNAEEVQASFTNYMKGNNDRYEGYTLGVNGCTTLSWWYINEYTNLTYANGNGAQVVQNLVGANSGLEISTTPKVPALFSVKGGVKKWGSSGGSYKDNNGNTIYPGHVGVVISIEETSPGVGKATVVHTGSERAGKEPRAFISTYNYPDSDVTFTYLGGNLK